ncbi:hypothetical protein HDU97_001888 [Phlyctochytrium planicorne]|nr:hypothetical protein HDU97_001888 [Phlyctochytrium planicorne]
MVHFKVKQSMTHADEYVDSSKVDKKKTWTPSYTIAVTALTKLFHIYRDNIGPGVKLINQAKFPKPVHVLVKKVYIPRRKEIRPLDMPENDAEGRIKAEWIDKLGSDVNTPAERVILFAHGVGESIAYPKTKNRGAYFMGNRKTHRAITWRLARYANARVLSIDYRLAPEHQFPTPINDMVSAYLHLIDPPEGFPKYRPDQIVFMGDSAGGNLSMAAMLYLRDSQWSMPAGLGLISPWMDLTHSSPSFVFNGAHDFLPSSSSDPKFIKEAQVHYYVPPGVDMHDPLCSPYFATEDAEKPYPPMLIQAGTAERLRDENISFYSERAANSKVQLELYEDMIHDWHLFTAVEPISKFAVRRLAEFAIQVTTPATATDFPRSLKYIRNKHGFPIEDFEDPIAFLEKERERLRSFKEECEKKSAAAVVAESNETVVAAEVLAVEEEVPAVAVVAKESSEATIKVEEEVVKSVEEEVKIVEEKVVVEEVKVVVEEKVEAVAEKVEVVEEVKKVEETVEATIVTASA